MSRDEHLHWAKERALKYLDAGDCTSALASMMSDLGKHPELADLVSPSKPVGQTLGMAGILAASQGATQLRRWIEGFNG